MDRRNFFKFAGGSAAAAGALVLADDKVQVFENPSYEAPAPPPEGAPEAVAPTCDVDDLVAWVAQESAQAIDQMLEARGYFQGLDFRKIVEVAQRGDCLNLGWGNVEPRDTLPRFPLNLKPKNLLHFDHHVFAQTKLRDVVHLFYSNEARTTRIHPLREALVEAIVARTPSKVFGHGVVASAPTSLPFPGSGACGDICTNFRFPVRCILTYDPNTLSQLLLLDVLFGAKAS